MAKKTNVTAAPAVPTLEQATKAVAKVIERRVPPRHRPLSPKQLEWLGQDVSEVLSETRCDSQRAQCLADLARKWLDQLCGDRRFVTDEGMAHALAEAQA